MVKLIIFPFWFWFQIMFKSCCVFKIFTQTSFRSFMIQFDNVNSEFILIYEVSQGFGFIIFFKWLLHFSTFSWLFSPLIWILSIYTWTYFWTLFCSISLYVLLPYNFIYSSLISSRISPFLASLLICFWNFQPILTYLF